MHRFFYFVVKFSLFANCKNIFLTFLLDSSNSRIGILVLYFIRKKKSLFIRILETFICINVFFNVTCCLLNHSFRIWYIFILLYFIFHLCVALNFKLDVSKFLIRNYASFIFIFISFVCIYLKIIITTWHFQIPSFAVYKRSF